MALRAPTTKAFQQLVYRHARRHYRDLPWRHTRNPYHILVSEVMLQQTQVDRVVAKYKTFLERFPTVEALAHAPLGDVLRAWQGLGYNRRAKMLHRCAKVVVSDHKGKLPRTHGELTTLPGVGPYTAGALLAFAHNKAHPIIETNIRTVYLHHYFKGRTQVSEQSLMKKVDATLDVERPRAWYTALMDYGAYLKKSVGNQNARSRNYTKQTTFLGSSRQVRGAIVRILAQEGQCTTRALTRVISGTPQAVRAQLASLQKEGLISKQGALWSLAS